MFAQPPDIRVPTLLRSSRSLGWSDEIRVEKFAEPDTMNGWREPVSPDIHVTVLTRGAMQMHYQRTRQRQKVLMDTGDLFILPAEIVPAQVGWTKLSEEPMQTTHIHLSHTLFQQSIEELADRDPNHVSLCILPCTQDPVLTSIALSLQNELENPSSVSKLYVETSAQMIIAHLLRHYTTDTIKLPLRQNTLSEQQIRWITEYVNAYLTNDLSLSALAQLVNFSTYHFARLFQQTTGETVHQFVLRQRLQRAQQLLVTTNLVIAEISQQTGFTDQSHLTHAFRRRYSMTPAAYRKMFGS